MSITNTQRELIDYLWEWAELKGDWAKLLVQKVTTSQTHLSATERQEVFNYFLQNIGFQFKPPLKTIVITKPSFSPPFKEVALTKLSEIKGVNRLADNQEMDFSPNITVIYGNNGVGKTGYSRILKSQGYSFDDNDEILSNVNENQIKQSAKIDFTSDGSPFFINWQGGRPESDLNAVSVFNSDCVNISLSNNRKLLVTPKGFYLFTLVTNELAELTNLLKAQYSKYSTQNSWKIQLHEATPQTLYINTLAYNSDESKLEEVSLFTEKHQTDLIKKEEELLGLNKIALQAKQKSRQFILTELTSIITSVKNIQSNLTETSWNSIKDYNAKIKTLIEKTQLGISELAEKNGLEQFNSDEFTHFLKSADEYIKLLAKENYPKNDDDTCVYCKQEFRSEQAKKLVDSYSTVLNDTTQYEISQYKKLKRDLVENVKLINESLVFHHPAFGVSANENVIQPQEIIDFTTRVKLFKGYIVNDKVSSDMEFAIDYTSIIEFLTAKQAEYLASQTTLVESIASITTTETKLKREIAELKDRKLVSENKQEVITSINNLLAHKLLNDNKSQLSTSSLSAKTTQAREELVSKDFLQKFTAELTNFRKQHLGVNLGFYSKLGSSHIQQNIAKYDIKKVLSEGEQKTIALCEFLTELQLDPSVAPVVFDDPVNSLDHLIINDVAKRLVDLSKERQVVVFTHNVIFYNVFFTLQGHTSYRDNTTFQFHNVYTDGVNTGLLSDGTPINKLKTYTSKLNHICNNGLGSQNENDVAAEGYDYLRTGLELLVSNTIFKEIVGRYRNNIMMTKFPAIKGDMIETHKAEIDTIFGRASGFIRAHSHPEEQNALPTINDLKADFERFKEIEKDFK